MAMTREEQERLAEELTKITGIKHYPTIEETIEAKFEELGYFDDNGNPIQKKNIGRSK